MSPKKTLVHIPQIYASRTDVGNVREHNEDSFAATSPFFAVADGMGGHEAGEVASEITINTLLERIPESPDPEQLAAAVRAANIAVLRAAADGTGKPGMGTTLTAALVYGDEVLIAQVGDSRAYLLHEGSLQRITRDHSLVADLIEQGRITEEEARIHPQRSVITRALGSDPEMEPDLYMLHVVEGDLLLLCSDGLTSMITDDAIEAIMLANPDPQAACNALVQESLAAGGLDNITTVVVDPLSEQRVETEEGKRLKVHSSMRETTADSVMSASAKSKRKGRKAPIIWAIAFVLIIAAAIGGFYAYAQNSYYLIAENGYVNVYRGLPGELGGISVSWLEEKTDVQIDKLPPTTKSRLEKGVSVDSLEDANELIATYQQATSVTGPDAQAFTGEVLDNTDNDQAKEQE